MFEIDFLPVGNGEKSGDAITMRYSNPDGPGYVVGVLDHGVLIQAQPTSSAPPGHRLYQAHIGLADKSGVDEGQARIEEVLSHACPGREQRTAWRRRQLARGRTGAVNYPGTTWRDRPAVDQGEGVYLAGDWVAAGGVLSEVSFASAIQAARIASSWVPTAEPAASAAKPSSS